MQMRKNQNFCIRLSTRGKYIEGPLLSRTTLRGITADIKIVYLLLTLPKISTISRSTINRRTINSLNDRINRQFNSNSKIGKIGKISNKYIYSSNINSQEESRSPIIM